MCTSEDTIHVKEFSKVIRTNDGDQTEHGFSLANQAYSIVDERIETKISVTVPDEDKGKFSID